jgi:hypothetical protein
MPPMSITTTEDQTCRDECSSGEPISTKSSAPCNYDATAQPRKHVTFATNISVHEVPHLKDLPEEELRATWYDQADFEAIKQSMIVTIRLMMANKPIGSDIDQCTRGLEFRTPAGSKIRKMSKMGAVTAVWNEQVSQWKDGRNDDEAIAEVYIKHGINSNKAARVVGIQDEQVVKECLSECREHWDWKEQPLYVDLTKADRKQAQKHIVVSHEQCQAQPRRASVGPSAA